jgi:CubicO group peptidase (beta-lactamase class C family)
MFIRKILVAAGLILLWALAVLAVVGLEAYFFSTPTVTRGDIVSIEKHLADRINAAVENRQIGAAGLALVNRGQIASVQGFGTSDPAGQNPVNPDQTLFRVASVSKAVTAWGVMKLVEEGKIGLDEPVMPHLTRWRFPGSDQYRDKVTVRQLLSHTAGLDDGLGYAGFPLGEPMQSVEESLNNTKDTTVGEPRPVRVAWEPGTAMAYGSGGYTILQLLVEEMSDKPFCEFMKHEVLKPMGMTHSTYDFEHLEAEGRLNDIAPEFDQDLRPQTRRRQVSQAGVGFYATPAELARFAQAYYGENPVLKPETLRQMMSPQPATGGSWGLGQTLFVENGAGGYIVGHDGGSPPAWGAWLRINPATGNGMVMTVSGGSGALNQLAHDWVYWETGTVTPEARMQKFRDRMFPAAIAIVIGALLIAVWRIFR